VKATQTPRRHTPTSTSTPRADTPTVVIVPTQTPAGEVQGVTQPPRGPVAGLPNAGAGFDQDEAWVLTGLVLLATTVGFAGIAIGLSRRRD
jgi:hypothetical protein